MEKFILKNDISVFYVQAESYPMGIQAAHDRLHAIVPFSPNRNYFGLSRPENNGPIVYRAATEEIKEGEAKQYNCSTLIIKKGNYVCITVNDFRKDVMSISNAFRELLSQPNIDPEGYCVEWYANDKEAVKCMVRLDE
jgi:hypothetical protein